MGPACPICGVEYRSRNGVRRHLHITHRKFEILDALLDEEEDSRTRSRDEVPA